MSFRGNCVICTDYFDVETDISVTPCGHLFHALCLNTWLTTNSGKKTCPQCRTHISMKQIVGKIYLNLPHEEKDDLDPYMLKNKLDEIQLSVRNHEKEKSELRDNLKVLEGVKDTLKKQIAKLKQKLTEEKNNLEILKDNMNGMMGEVSEARLCKAETKKLRQKLRTLEKLEVVLNGQQKDVDEMIQQYSGGTQSNGTKQLATFCVAMKQEYEVLKESKSKLNIDLMKVRRDLHKKEDILLQKMNQIEELENSNANLTSHEESLLQENKSLKHKLKALQLAISSPSDTKSSAVSRLIAESPAPEFLTPLQDSRNSKRDRFAGDPILMKKPRLSVSFNEEDNIETFPSPHKQKVSTDSPATMAKKVHCVENGFKFVRTKSTVGTLEANQSIKVFSNRFKKTESKKGSIPWGYDQFCNPIKQPIETKIFNKAQPEKPSGSKISFSSSNNSNFNKFSGSHLNKKRFNRLKRV